MSAEAVGWVYRFSPYRGATFQIHLAIADVVSDLYDNEFWAAMGTLAHKARVERVTATKGVAALVTDEFLMVVEDHRSDRAGRPSRYRFVFVEGLSAVFETRWGAYSLRTPKSRGVSSDNSPGVRSDNSGGAYPVLTNPINPTEVTQDLSSTVVDKSAPDYGFDRWWQAYPRRHGKRVKKREAQVKWRRLTYEIKAQVYKATLNYAAACNAEEQIAMDPYRFIGATKRWEDWLDPPESAPSPALARANAKALGCEKCEGGWISGPNGLERCPACFPTEATG